MRVGHMGNGTSHFTLSLLEARKFDPHSTANRSALCVVAVFLPSFFPPRCRFKLHCHADDDIVHHGMVDVMNDSRNSFVSTRFRLAALYRLFHQKNNIAFIIFAHFLSLNHRIWVVFTRSLGALRLRPSYVCGFRNLFVSKQHRAK